MTSLDYIKLGLPQLGASISKRRIITSGNLNISANSTVEAQLAAYPGYALYSVKVSSAAWVRFFSSVAKRSADLQSGRSRFSDPAPGSGVIAEIVTNGPNQTIELTPPINGYVLDAPINGTSFIPIGVTNNLPANVAITIEVVLTRLED